MTKIEFCNQHIPSLKRESKNFFLSQLNDATKILKNSLKPIKLFRNTILFHHRSTFQLATQQIKIYFYFPPKICVTYSKTALFLS